MRILLILLLCVFCSCESYPGPDKQFAGTLTGAVTGAGAGAVTGLQLGAGTGPGALAGAGFGALAGGVHGAVKDMLEEDLLYLSAQTKRERNIALAQELLADHYRRRMELHPTRDIYPADMFFYADEVKLCSSATTLVNEIVKLNKRLHPWSRLVIATYVKSSDDQSFYARHLAERRASELGLQFVRAGVEPRRVELRPMVVLDPVLVDPTDHPQRYSQAVELISIDR